MARIGRAAYRLLLQRAMANNSSMAEELDKVLSIQEQQLELFRPAVSFEVARLPHQVEVSRANTITVVKREVKHG